MEPTLLEMLELERRLGSGQAHPLTVQLWRKYDVQLLP